MVFSNYSNASYLPLDSDQGVAFYKNENLLFSPPPPAAAAASPTPTLVCRRNSPVSAAMLSTSTGSSPFSGQPLLHGPRQHHGNNVCDDFQPVAHLSSNGYYGYVPPAKVMSTEQAAGTPPTHVNGNGVGILLDSIHPVTAAAAAATGGSDSYSMMMDCGGGGGGNVQVENYHQQQQQQPQQHLRKRKDYYSEEVEANYKRRKTWLEQPSDASGFVHSPSWNQPSPNQMDCQDQPMDTFSPQQQFHQQSPITMNAPTTIAFNGFHHHHHPEEHHQSTLISTPPMAVAAPPQQHTILQPRNRLFHASPPSPNMSLLGSTERTIHQLSPHNRRPSFGGADDCQQLEVLFNSLHGSGFFMAC